MREDVIIQLDKAFEELVDIMPDRFKKSVLNSMFISGGAIYSLYNNKDVNDFDFFTDNRELAEEIVDYFNLYTKPFKNMRVGEINGVKIMTTKYAISFNNKYQIVIKFNGSEKDVAEQFDFKHNMFTYRYKGAIKCHSEWSYLKDSRLRFNDGRTRDLCGTLLRIPKFCNKGFTVTKKEVAKIIKRLEENGFDDREKEILKDYTTY